MDRDKAKKTEQIIQIFGSGSVFIFIGISFIMWMISNYIIKDYENGFMFIKNYSLLIISATLALVVLFYFGVFKNLSFIDRPENDDPFENKGWSEEEKQLKVFGQAHLDLNEPIDTAGSPFNLIKDPKDGKDLLLYEKDPTHSLWVATTRAGKSRKIVLQLFALIIKAGESVIVNDPKKELWKMSHKLFEDHGYKVHLLDFRNLKYSDCYNPMDNINYFIDRDMVDDADTYANDIVESIVVDNNHGEKIWIDGQKALLKSLILAVSQANVSNDKKNFYSVYQMLAVDGKTIKVDDEEKMILSAYMESLKEDNIARTSFAPIQVAPEKTRGSFNVSTLATLRLFSSKSLMKTLSKSDFSFDEFINSRHILFVDNPDEKTTYNSIAAIIFDQAYQRLVYHATQMEDQKLEKKVHMVFDEFGNMPTISNMGSKVSVALSRGIPYYFFIQSFSQIDIKYGKEEGENIRDNTNFLGFISTGNMETAKQISERIGKKTIWLDNRSGNFNDTASVTGGGISWTRSQEPLITPNNLIEQDVRDGHGILIAKTYFPSSRVYLPDTTAYPWSDKWDIKMKEFEKEGRTLAYAIPRYVEVSDAIIQLYYNVKRSNGFPADEKENMYWDWFMSQQSKRGLSSDNLYWYWSMSEDLDGAVFENIMKFVHDNGLLETASSGKQIKLSANARAQITRYLDSDEFNEWISIIDYHDTGQIKQEEEMILNKQREINKTITDLESSQIKRNKLRITINNNRKEVNV